MNFAGALPNIKSNLWVANSPCAGLWTAIQAKLACSERGILMLEKYKTYQRKHEW